MTSHICRECRKSYDRPEEVEERYRRDHPEAAGLCLDCIGRMGYEKAMEEP